VDVMLEKIPGIARSTKLRIIKLIEADLNQVLRASFVRNVTKLAQNHKGLIIDHQYGCLHWTCISPILNKLLTIQITSGRMELSFTITLKVFTTG
jgi:hypothetical protein